MSEYVWIYDNRQGSECLIWYILQSHSTRYSELIERWAYSEPCQRSKIQHWGKDFFVNMKEVWIFVGIQLRKGSEYFRVPNMPDFCISKCYKRFWMSEYGWMMPDYDRVLNVWSKFHKFLNMPGLGIWQGFEYVRRMQVLNMPE